MVFLMVVDMIHQMVQVGMDLQVQDMILLHQMLGMAFLMVVDGHKVLVI
jgi:hypothetical protein